MIERKKEREIERKKERARKRERERKVLNDMHELPHTHELACEGNI